MLAYSEFHRPIYIIDILLMVAMRCTLSHYLRPNRFMSYTGTVNLDKTVMKLNSKCDHGECFAFVILAFSKRFRPTVLRYLTVAALNKGKEVLISHCILVKKYYIIIHFIYLKFLISYSQLCWLYYFTMNEIRVY